MPDTRKPAQRKPRSAGQVVAVLLRFHRTCSERRCRREKFCCGERDHETCIKEQWPRVSERSKTGVREIFNALKDGKRGQAVLDAMEAGMKRYDELFAPAPLVAPEPETHEEEAADDTAPAPRVRSL